MLPLKRSVPSLPLFLGVLVPILLFAAFLRFSAVDYALPYILNLDEPNVYRLTQDMRGVLEAGWRAEWLAGYPPGYMAFYQVVVEGMNGLHLFDIHQDMGKVIGMMRIVNALVDMLTMALVIHLARQLVDWRAALLAVAAALVALLMRSWSKTIQIVIGVVCVAVLVPDLVSYALPLRLTNPYTQDRNGLRSMCPITA